MDRIKDPKLMEIYRNKRCMVCGSNNGVSGHHLKSRGSWGPDVPENLIPLCFNHHVEVHKIGLLSFSSRYFVVENFLTLNRWTLCPIRGKWTNSTLGEID